jgi:hexokinase
VEGHDVGRLLSEALSAAGLNISVVAVLNDTTGFKT